MPATSETLALYAEALITEYGYAKSTAEGRLSSVKALHRLRGHPVPDGVAAWYVLRGGDTTPTDTPKVNTPIVARRASLIAIAGVCDLERPAGARDLCLATLAWDLYAGEEELVALDLADVTATSDGLVVRLSGEELPVGHDHDPPEICPVEAAARWIGVLAGCGSRSGPLFRSVDRGDNIAGCGPKAGPAGEGGRLGVRGLQKIWARLTVKADLPRSTPRALRLGGAVDDLADGRRLDEVLDRGRWSVNSPAVVRRLAQALSEEGES